MLLRARTPPRGERHGAPGSRRHKRFTNEQFLLKGKADFTEEELKQLLDPVEWKDENPWQDDRVLWDKFCNATPEEQSRMLGSNQNATRRADPTRLNRRTRALLRGHAETQFGRDVFSRIGAFAANEFWTGWDPDAIEYEAERVLESLDPRTLEEREASQAGREYLYIQPTLDGQALTFTGRYEGLNAALFDSGLGLDSIAALEIAIALENHYGVTVEDDPEKNQEIFASVASLARFVSENRPA